MKLKMNKFAVTIVVMEAMKDWIRKVLCSKFTFYDAVPTIEACFTDDAIIAVSNVLLSGNCLIHHY